MTKNYHQRPVHVRAVRWLGDNFQEVRKFFTGIELFGPLGNLYFEGEGKAFGGGVCNDLIFTWGDEDFEVGLGQWLTFSFRDRRIRVMEDGQFRYTFEESS